MKRFFSATIFAVIFILSSTLSASSPKIEQVLADKILGDPDAPVTIIEYSSLTCSHCRKFHVETLPKLKKNYIDTGKVKLIFRDFPFDQLGLIAAVMARCAAPERYFAFIEVLFVEQLKWTRSQTPLEALSKIGKLGGLNPKDFEECLKNEALINGIVENRLDGQKRFDVNATPTFIIDDDHKIVGAEPYEEFDKILARKVK